MSCKQVNQVSFKRTVQQWVIGLGLCGVLIGASGAAQATEPGRFGPRPMGAPNGIATPVLHYQGRLLELNGTAKPDGAYSIQFALYAAATSGTALWTETKNIQVVGGSGFFSTLLGEATALSLAAINGQALWLGVKVGADSELAPRQRLASVAYAVYANTASDAEALGGQPANAYAPATHNHFGQTWSGDGAVGISVTNASATGTGVYGKSAGGVGVLGVSSSFFGVRGESVTRDGVDGFSEGNNVAGVHGRNDNATGVGVSGFSANGTGTRGESFGGKGIYGITTGTGYAGYFDGKVHINGTLSKSAGSFKIDHPLDPANKYLSHSFVESPDMLNIYNGNVTTGDNGEAPVVLPDYFEALNKDFRYQLTVIGQFAQVMVAQEIVNNAFVIKTDKPNVKVSWQVTGIRKDAYTKDHPIVVEENKPLQERGTYLYPAGQTQINTTQP